MGDTQHTRDPQMDGGAKTSRVGLALNVLQTIFTALLLVGLFFAYQTLNLSYQALKSDHDQRRRHYTMHLYDQWREIMDLTRARLTLEKIRSKDLTDDELRLIAAGKDIPPKYNKEQVYEMRQHIVSMLNLFEQIAVGYRDNVGDRDMIKRYFKEVISKNRKSLEPFVHEWVENKSREGWKPLDEVIQKEWNEPLPSQRELP